MIGIESNEKHASRKQPRPWQPPLQRIPPQQQQQQHVNVNANANGRRSACVRHVNARQRHARHARHAKHVSNASESVSSNKLHSVNCVSVKPHWWFESGSTKNARRWQLLRLLPRGNSVNEMLPRHVRRKNARIENGNGNERRMNANRSESAKDEHQAAAAAVVARAWRHQQQHQC